MSMAAGFDKGRVYSAQVLAGNEDSRAPDAPVQVEQNLYEFLQRFRTGNDYVYRDRLRANLLAKQNVIDVQLEHLQLWSNALAQAFREGPAEMLPLVRADQFEVLHGIMTKLTYALSLLDSSSQRPDDVLRPSYTLSRSRAKHGA